jgi:hypothetical protein
VGSFGDILGSFGVIWGSFWGHLGSFGGHVELDRKGIGPRYAGTGTTPPLELPPLLRAKPS